MNSVNPREPTFLTSGRKIENLIGGALKCNLHSLKINSWESTFTSTSSELKKHSEKNSLCLFTRGLALPSESVSQNINPWRRTLIEKIPSVGSFISSLVFSPFQKIYLLLFLAALGLCCCAWAFSSCGEQGLLFIAVRGLLIAVASFVVEHGL